MKTLHSLIVCVAFFGLVVGCLDAPDLNNPPSDDDDDTVVTDPDNDGDGSPQSADCNDSDPAIYPGAPELCNGYDNDCDGEPGFDEVDGDSDGYMICAGDCSDEFDFIYPDAPELCNGWDDDCNGVVPANESDQDDDGYLACEDCDDDNANIHPFATEICNGLDDDCDATTGVGGPNGEADLDGDDFMYCNGECDDSNASVHPGMLEGCNGIDDDCDPSTEQAGGEADGDLDGYLSCEDCNDSDSNIYPGAGELCNGWDDNCDGGIPADEVDDDNDGHMVCAGDCDDSRDDVYPGATELCNGIDDNCDGIDPTDEYEGDNDNDGFFECEDCNDVDATIYPTAPELCNGIDDDCDGTIPTNESSWDGDFYRECADCDDSNATIYPGAEELCDDGIDQDCDGLDEVCGPELEVSLSNSQPMAVTLPGGAVLVPVMDFDFTASGGDIPVTDLRVGYDGIGSNDNVVVYLYIDGELVSSEESLSMVVVPGPSAFFTGLPIVIPDGATERVTLMATTSLDLQPGDTMHFFVLEASWVGTTATVTGNFGFDSALFTTSTQNAGSVTITNSVPIVSPPSSSQDAYIAGFAAEPFGEAACVESIKLHLDNAPNCTGYELWSGPTMLSDTVTVYSDAIEFVIPVPPMLPLGVATPFQVFADVEGDPGDQFGVYVENGFHDFRVVGDFYSYYMNVDTSDYDGDDCVDVDGECSFIELF